jgi:hypothetical protein
MLSCSEYFLVCTDDVSNIPIHSPARTLKVLTPKKKYSSNILFSPRFSIFDQSPQTTTVSPKTKTWISQLIDLPTPPKTFKNDKSTTSDYHTLTQNKLLHLRRLLKKKLAIINTLKQSNKKIKNKSISVSQFFEKANFPSRNSKALVSMQLLHKKRKSWSVSEKNIALSLYYKSPSAYMYMRKNGIILPGGSTVRRWLNSINYTTGFSEKYIKQLKLKLSDMTYSEKKCVILLDEISIMKCIEYNSVLDEIEGYEDLGRLGRTDKFGSHALVIMLRGLYSNWKFPLAYFLTGSGVKGNDLVIIINDCVKTILDIGLQPTSIVCDQGTQNRRMFSLLGGTEENPSTIICDKKLYLIYDMPHLLKSVRNNLLSGNIKVGNKIISFGDIQKTYEIDKKNTIRAMCKITPTHLSPNPFQKMSCKLAVQLLSKSVSAAIKTCVSTGELESNTAINTAEFINIVNDMFDSCNSKNLFEPNPNKKPMCEKNLTVFQNLEKARSIFKKTKKICNKTRKNSTPPCFTGIVWTITALFELYSSEKLDMINHQPEKEFFLLTNRLTQDALENFFSIMRQKNGYVNNYFNNFRNFTMLHF